MSISMMFKDKKFAPLMWTQFFGALNDNVLKNALVVLLAFKSIELWGLKSEFLISLATLIFILPFFLFSALSGQISDRFEKSIIIRGVKIAEIVIMLIAALGFYFSKYEILFVVLFLMGIHSTVFGPVKYSSLPELAVPEKLTTANAYVEVGTFIAILLGTISGGYLISIKNGEYYVIEFLILNSIVGYIFSRGVHKMKIGDPNLKINLNPIPPTISTLAIAKKNKAVFNSILGISWFWFLGAVILSLLPTITKNIVNGNEHIVTLFLASFTVGIALGAVICEKLSYETVEIGLVPFGSIGMSVFLIDLASVLSKWKTINLPLDISGYFISDYSTHLLFDLFMIAIFGGVFTVPLYTLIQQRSSREIRSRIIGANNIMNALFMVVGSALLMFFLKIKLEISTILVIYAILNLVVSIYIYLLVPEFTLRFLTWIVAHLLYRLKTIGRTHIPKEGAAILVCNHVSFVDWLIISAAIKRPIRFVMYYKFANIPVLKYLLKHGGVIPIAGKNEDPHLFEQAFIKISENLREGRLVCIFPEGGLTADGIIQPFKKGVEYVLQKDPVPVIPMGITGLWGSIFSHQGSPALKKIPRKFWLPIVLRIEASIPPDKATASELESHVKKLVHYS
jgi:1-acyl-sn-glycerol-3-phosphate acyltransferase